MPTFHDHLSDAALRDFLLGTHADSQSADFEQHLSECSECQTRAAVACSEDTFVELLAAARVRLDAKHAFTATPSLVLTQGYDYGSRFPKAGDIPPGELLDHPKYRVVSRLGAGGMGSVWRAEHAVMKRSVAVKVIRPDLLAKPGAADRFLREVRAAASLHHPNIVTAFDAEVCFGSCLLAMEFVPGETLSELVKLGPLPAVEACRAIRDAARGLAHAHAVGLVHRDVKPSNLIRTTDGTVKVLDFGLVVADLDRESGLTGENMVIGTPDYIAPEQAIDARTADARADIYSLGCTLYHLLSGHVPFPAESVLAKLDAHRDPSRFPAPLADVSPQLAAVVSKMMAKRPATRYRTAAEVVEALEPFCDWRAGLREEPGDASQSGGLRRTARRSRRHWAIAAGLLLASIGLAAGAVIYKIQRDNEVVTVETDDPNIEIVMKRNGEIVRIVDTKSKRAWELDTKKMRLTPDGGELSIELPGREPLIIRRNGDRVMTIKREATTVATPAFKPTPPRLRSAADFRSVTDFRVVRGATVAELRLWCEQLPAGFYPSSLTARSATTTPLFDAVAVRDGRSVKFAVHFELGNHNKQADFDAMSQAGWAFKGACTYPAEGKFLVHHVWITDDGKGWLADGIRLGGVPDAAQRWKRSGLRPRSIWLNDLDVGKGAPTRALGVLAEPDQGLAWRFFAELGAKELIVELAEARRQGFRPDALAALGDGQDRTYSLSLVPNSDNLAWDFQAGMSSDRFEAHLAEQKKLIRRPLIILSEGEGAATHISALWIEYARSGS